MARALASPSEHAGDFQGVSNIDAPDAWKVYEAWYDQSFADDQASVRVGLYDLNSEFDVIESAGLFIHPSFGIGPDYSQSGQNGPSIFPTTSLALRLAYTFDTNYYIQAAILDGVPGDLGNDNGTQIQLGDNEGALYALELGYTQGGEGAADRYAKWALGAWHYSEKFDDLMDLDSNDNPIRRNNNQGIYALAEYEFFRESDQSEQGATAFVRYGIANDDVNQIDSYFGTGIVYTGLLPGRDEDQFGIAIAITSNGSKYKQWQISEGNRVDDRETAIELSYRMQVFPWLAIQPDLQWIKNPSMDPSISDVTMVGVRTEIVF
jgi:porin